MMKKFFINYYYIWGTTFIKADEVFIADSNNSSLETVLTRNGDTDYYTLIIYGFIGDFTESYYLVINGQKINLCI